jgi:hypothetical protein
MGLSLKTCVKLMIEIFTKEQIKEYVKCKIDPVYFINTYVKYNDLLGLCDFKLYPFQEKIVKQFHNNRYNLCVSSRQSGKTLIPLLYILHQLIFSEYSSILVITLNKMSAESILLKLKKIYTNLPLWMQMKVNKNTSNYFGLENFSTVMVSDYNINLIKGQNFNHVFLDEFAFFPGKNAKDFFDYVVPCLSAGRISKLHIISTKKTGSYFNKLIETYKVSSINKILEFFGVLLGKKKDTSNWVVGVYNWNVVPGRDKKWKQEMINMLGVNAFKEEFEV